MLGQREDAIGSKGVSVVQHWWRVVLAAGRAGGAVAEEEREDERCNGSSALRGSRRTLGDVGEGVGAEGHSVEQHRW